MSDKPFDPVTEGTPKEFMATWPYKTSDMPEFVWESKIAALIAARDAAIRAKALSEDVPHGWVRSDFSAQRIREEREKGRLKGLEEAAEICKSNRYRGAWQAIRAAAETAKEGGR